MPRKSDVTAAEASRKSRSRVRGTYERILDAAAYVLSRKGYAGMRPSDVADQAEIQVPAVDLNCFRPAMT